MGAGKNKSHRKKRISKHVLDAQERKKNEEIEKKLVELEGGNSSSGDGDGADKHGNSSKAAADDGEPSRPVSSTSNKKTKDPEEAASYLANWALDRKSGTKCLKIFKFNKNTSSWLQRHCYDFDKVSKNTFALLVEYLCQGAEGARLRTEEDAKRRARRYKDWEKSQENNAGGGEEEETDEKKEKDESASDEGRVWSELSDHDKRKEYKRARKLIDALKATRETNAEA